MLLQCLFTTCLKILLITLMISISILPRVSSQKHFNEDVRRTNVPVRNDTDAGVLHVVKRNVLSGVKCSSSENCNMSLPGGLCLNGICTCPTGFVQGGQEALGCFPKVKNLGDPCYITAQCGEDLACQNNACLCQDGAQLFQVNAMNMCLYWRRPLRLINRCKNNEDCLSYDPNAACKKRWCQCRENYQLFETKVFGVKHKCFKTYSVPCFSNSDCSKHSESSNEYCICHGGFCHCMPNVNTSMSDIYNWVNEKPTWYQRWKKDLILATRLLFITVILFFIPCFIYATLGVRERSRQLFSHLVRPSRSPTFHNQRRSSDLRRVVRAEGPSHVVQPSEEARHVEITYDAHGVNSRLLGAQTRPLPPNMASGPCAIQVPLAGRGHDRDKVYDDSPPSYEEIMQAENVPEMPPPPYREI